MKKPPDLSWPETIALYVAMMVCTIVFAVVVTRLVIERL